jgi:hypothetical protein
MALVDEVISGISAIRTLIQDWVTADKAKSTKVRESIRKTLDAAIETRSYLALQRQGEKPDKEKEKTLAKLWLDAGIALQEAHVGGPESIVAQRSLIKAQYWSDREIWDGSRTPGLSIDLDRIEDECRKILSRTER